MTMTKIPSRKPSGTYGHGPLKLCFWKGKDDDHDQDFLKNDLLHIWSWSSDKSSFRGAESMVMKFHGNVRGEVRVNFLALFASKPHIFMCRALKLSGIVRANVRLNIAIPMPFLSPILHVTSIARYEQYRCWASKEGAPTAGRGPTGGVNRVDL